MSCYPHLLGWTCRVGLEKLVVWSLKLAQEVRTGNFGQAPLGSRPELGQQIPGRQQ
jgi:hypothetical protein